MHCAAELLVSLLLLSGHSGVCVLSCLCSSALVVVLLMSL